MSSIVVAGDTSGSITIAAPAVAGSGTLTLPVATDTLVGKATTDTLTNKSIAATQLTGTIAAAALPAGSVLQVVSSKTSTMSTTTANIPQDNSIPQITEGAQFLSLAITPKSATNTLVFNINLAAGANVAGTTYVVALFQDSTANALCTNWTTVAGVNYIHPISMNYFMTSGTTSSTTFTVRAGPGQNTLTVNGVGAAAYFGGTLFSSITITEIAV
jgi:hypothetical protein